MAGNGVSGLPWWAGGRIVCTKSPPPPPAPGSHISSRDTLRSSQSGSSRTVGGGGSVSSMAELKRKQSTVSLAYDAMPCTSGDSPKFPPQGPAILAEFAGHDFTHRDFG